MPSHDDHRDLSHPGEREFDRVEEGLAGRPDRDAGTHEARKALKRLRALLRLARPHLGKRSFREHDRPLRDLGRSLADLRDARVALDLLDDVAAGACPVLRSRLEDRYRDALAAVGGGSGALTVEAGDARHRWQEAFALGTVAWAGGLERTRRRAQSRFERARDRGSDDDFHEWRKEVKHMRYQGEELAGADIGVAVPALEVLGEMLGEEHDLTVLIALVVAEENCGGERAPLLEALEIRRSALRRDALAAGDALFGSAGRDD